MPSKKLRTIKSLEQLYTVERNLGKGSFGEVKLCRHKKFGTEFAVKIVSKEKVQENQVYLQLMKEELEVL